MMGIVYCAREKSTGKIYVGATTATLMDRKKDHLYKATKGSSLEFHKRIKEFGLNSFSWVVLASATSKNELALKERYFIRKYNSYNDGYNGDSGGGFKKWVYQYNHLREHIASFNSLGLAAKLNNVEARGISNACLGILTTYKEYFWSYIQHGEYPLLESKREKRVFQYECSNELVAIYDSVSCASKLTGLSKTTISRVCRGERDKAGGFIWRYD